MDQTESVKLLYSTEVAPLISSTQALEPNIRAETIPSFDEMFNSAAEHYPYDRPFDEARDEPAAVLHSSGSTGLPKPITMTHGSFAVLDNEHNLPSVPGRKKRDWTMWSFKGDGRLYTVFPFFHLGGFLMFTVATIFGSTSIVFGPPNVIPDGTLLRNIMLHQKLQALLLPPAVVEQLLLEPDGIDFFRRLDFLAYSGAPFNHAIGDKLSEVVELVSPFGSTETYPIAQLATEREDWAWLEFNPFIKHEMQLFDSDEGSTYELVLIADESTKDTAAVYHNLPGVGKFYTKDLFTRHPDKPHLFKYYGRKDDIIVLSNGEKFNPIPLEVSLQGHPSLKGALVIGNHRTQATLLIEPKEPLDEGGRAELIEALWPLLEKSNLLVAGQGRIHRGRVVCALPSKPFTRTGKGTVVRRLTEEAYREEIGKVYSDTSDGNVIVDLKPSLKPVYEIATVVGFLRGVLAASFPPGATIGEDEDFFAHGMDSIQTLQVVSGVKHNLHSQASKSVGWITPQTIFHNPTLHDLSRLVADFLNNDVVPGAENDLTRARAVDDIVTAYLGLLPARSALHSEASPKPWRVAVIGSTGYLGSYLVATLLRSTDISRVYCLNRSRDAQKRQEEALHELDASISPTLLQKMEYMTIELGQPGLRLTHNEYEKIANEADVVVYNAWRLDFGLSIRSFHPFLRATIDIVELAATSKRNIHVVFVSSVSSVGKMATKTTVPEALVRDSLAASNLGYGQSKLAAERILAAANELSGIPVSIVRVCQLGGPTPGQAGKWADQPWLSALARTSRALKCVPSHVTAIDWVAVDVAAEMLRDFILRPVQKEAQFYHICDPRPQPWEALADVLCQTLNVTDTVPLLEWTKKLRSMADSDTKDLATLPAVTILGFLEALGDGTENSTFATDRAASSSHVIIPVLDREVLGGWLRSWSL